MSKHELFSLGKLAISDFVEKQPEYLEKHELKLIFDDDTLQVSLSETVDQSKMYGKYWYRSGTNSSMKCALKDVVDSCLQVKKSRENDVWLDIASNDGTLLSFVPKTMKRIGIDPADNSFTSESKRHANEIIQDFFSKEAFAKTSYSQASYISCIAMFYDLAEPDIFLKDIYQVLEDDGLFVLQMSYTPLMVEQLAFDNICHEHVKYYTLTSMKMLLEKHGFVIRDCQLNDVNGGSFRLYIQKELSNPSSFGSSPYRDVCSMRVKSLLRYEATTGVNTVDYYLAFFAKIQRLKEEVVNFIKREKALGKSIFVYGASTKGNTLLQWFDLDNSLIDGAVERSPYKFGLKTIATDIPIYSEEYVRALHPDYLLILPWHFIDEFKEREKVYLQKGGKFIVPCPKFEVISI